MLEYYMQVQELCPKETIKLLHFQATYVPIIMKSGLKSIFKKKKKKNWNQISLFTIFIIPKS